MNTEQVASLIRTLLQFAGALAVSKGWTDESTAAAVTGAVLTLAVTAWGLYARRNAALVASAAAVPGVDTIVADRRVAGAVPSAKVRPRG